MKLKSKTTNNPVTKAWENGLRAIKEGRRDDARDFFDMGIVMIATYADEGHEDDDYLIEGVRKGLWHTRFWKVGLENNNLILG